MRRPPRPRPAVHLLSAALVLVAGLGACGEDEPTGSDRGGEVEGRVPDATPTSGGDPSDVEPSTTAETTSATAGDPTSEAPETTAAPAETDPPPDVALDSVAVTLTEVATVDAPTKLVARPGSDLLYVAEQGGRVILLRPDGDALDDAGAALDVTDVTRSGGEQGLLGLAFSPDGETLYVHHSGLDGETRVASFAMDGDAADPASRIDLLEVAQPYPNHNGGELVVGDDGLLWIGLGDGGSGGDPDDRAQDPDDLLGKVLRIDPTRPEGDRPYGIPEDNPYAQGGGRPEIAVVGLRNPWRLRFDPTTGDLWVADVGQSALEEIDHVPAGEVLGANLGWSRFEGSDVYDENREVRDGPARGPVFEMAHDDGWCSVTGGALYRGDAIGGLSGAYLFGDFCKPGLNALRLVDGEVTESAVLDSDVEQVVSIDTDSSGEVYVLSLGGSISRLDRA